MASETFTKADVENALQRFVPIKIDIDRDRPTTERYQIDSVPTFMFIDDEGNVVKQITGGMDAAEFIAWLNRPARLP